MEGITENSNKKGHPLDGWPLVGDRELQSVAYQRFFAFFPFFAFSISVAQTLRNMLTSLHRVIKSLWLSDSLSDTISNFVWPGWVWEISLRNIVPAEASGLQVTRTPSVVGVCSIIYAILLRMLNTVLAVNGFPVIVVKSWSFNH